MWQKAMSVVLQSCQGVVYYIDNVQVTGQTRKEHGENLHKVFQRSEHFGLRVKLSKCKFFQEQVEFLGGRASIHPTKERVEGILSAAEPSNKKELQSFLVLMTHNVKFLPSLADVQYPLYTLLKKVSRWTWGKHQKKASKRQRSWSAKHQCSLTMTS